MVSVSCRPLFPFRCTQAILLGASAASLVALWGAAPGSELCAAALDYLSVRVAGAPVTLLMLVLQVSWPLCHYAIVCW